MFKLKIMDEYVTKRLKKYLEEYKVFTLSEWSSAEELTIRKEQSNSFLATLSHTT
jgi:hypothetical protein